MTFRTNPRRTSTAALLATWFGCGFAPVAPGTVGSAAGVAIAAALHEWAGWPAWSFAVLAVAMFVPAVWAAGTFAEAMGKEDPGQVVIDEVLGQWVTLAGAASFGASLGWFGYVAGFALFRLFDIWKPFPIRRLESLHGGLGIIADDIGAGVYGSLVLCAFGWFNR